MYKKVLVPMALDHGMSPQMLAAAKALTGGDGEILALHVYEEPSSAMRAYVDEKALAGAFERSEQMMAEKLSNIEGVTGEVVKGHTYRMIIEYAQKHSVDCIVIGSHKPDLSDYFLGSTAARVVRHAPCAVHVHRS